MPVQVNRGRYAPLEIVMKSQLPSYRSLILGFASALLCYGAFSAVVEYSTFTSGGEFSTALGSAGFQFFIWGIVMLLFSGAGFAVALTPVLRFRRQVPFPFGIGLGGSSVVAGGAFGRISDLGGATGLPFPVFLALAGAVVGSVILLLAFMSTAPISRHTSA